MAVDLLVRGELSVHHVAGCVLVADVEQVDTAWALGRALHGEATHVACAFGVLNLTAALIHLDGLRRTVELYIIRIHLGREGLPFFERPWGEGEACNGRLVVPLVETFVRRGLGGGLPATAEGSDEGESKDSEAESEGESVHCRRVDV